MKKSGSVCQNFGQDGNRAVGPFLANQNTRKWLRSILLAGMSSRPIGGSFHVYRNCVAQRHASTNLLGKKWQGYGEMPTYSETPTKSRPRVPEPMVLHSAPKFLFQGDDQNMHF